jgi:PKD repeat protein
MSFPTLLPLQASVTDAEHGPGQLFYSWQLSLHHNSHSHPEVPDTNKSTFAFITPVGCDTAENYWYRIKLTVTDIEGLSSFVEQDIFPACNAPQPDFTADKLFVCNGEQIQFTDLSTGLPDYYTWTFNGGTPANSTLKNPLVTYNTAGTYSVTLQTENFGGTTSNTKTAYITVYNKPSATITPSGTDSVCPGTSVLLSANTGSNLTYQWLKGNVPVSGATQSTYTASVSGTYKVVVTRSTNGCSKTSAGKKIVVRQVINPVIQVDGSTTFCNGDSVKLFVTPVAGYTYQWRRNGVDLAGATDTVYYAKNAGTYKVRATDANGCTKVSQSGVTVTVPCKINSSGIAEHNIEMETVMVSPNPASEFISVFSNSGLDLSHAEIKIYDLAGRMVLKSAADATLSESRFEMDIRLLPEGSYIIQLTGEGKEEKARFSIVR